MGWADGAACPVFAHAPTVTAGPRPTTAATAGLIMRTPKTASSGVHRPRSHLGPSSDSGARGGHTGMLEPNAARSLDSRARSLPLRARSDSDHWRSRSAAGDPERALRAAVSKTAGCKTGLEIAMWCSTAAELG